MKKQKKAAPESALYRCWKAGAGTRWLPRRKVAVFKTARDARACRGAAPRGWRVAAERDS